MSAMDEQEISFSHPHDHFQRLHITAIPNTCFVLMPFDPKFHNVYNAIVSGAPWSDDGQTSRRPATGQISA